jgi:hypothetical protein
MIDRPFARLDDVELGDALRFLSDAIDWPVATPSTVSGQDLATRVRIRLTDPDRRRTAVRGWWPVVRPVRRSLIFAVAVLLTLAVIAGAVGLGLPGLRLILGPPPPGASPIVTPDGSLRGSLSATPSGTPRPPGSALGLGRPVTVSEVTPLTGVRVALPTVAGVGAPDAVYVDLGRGDQIAYVWAPGPALPATREPGIGLIVMRFDGRIDQGFYDKAIDSGTTVEPVTVRGARGYWISGAMHYFFYVRPDGTVVDDGRRWVGDALIWNDGLSTYRIESALGQEATVALAEAIR